LWLLAAQVVVEQVALTVEEVVLVVSVLSLA
jgi:hypothetical protein